jgi:stress response protein YsnF
VTADSPRFAVGPTAAHGPVVSDVSEREPDLAVVPLAEEALRVSTREVVTGEVRVSTIVDTKEEMVRRDLHTEHVTVTRVPIDRYVETAPAIRTEGDVTIIRVMEEVLVVETRLLLREEVHICRTLTMEPVAQSVKLRKQLAVIEGQDSDDVAKTELGRE